VAIKLPLGAEMKTCASLVAYHSRFSAFGDFWMLKILNFEDFGCVEKPTIPKHKRQKRCAQTHRFCWV
jgi:hypothetical protein